MRIRIPGKVHDGLWFLGREESGVYLLEGTREAMLISGGMGYLVPDVLQQMEDFGLESERIRKILILHAHFDHVGIIPYLKRLQPDIEVIASKRGWEILSTPKARKTINDFGRIVAERIGALDVYENYDLDWRDDITGTVVGDGDRIDLGDTSVQVYETPGHSSCSISAYVPEMRALFPSDGGGIPFRQTILSSGNSNYTKFQESLEKLKDVDVAYLCADHYGYVVGDEARDYIGRSIKLAQEHRYLMEDCYLRTGSIDAAAKEMVDSFFAEYPDYFLSREIFEGVYRQMVRHVALSMDSGRSER